MKKGLTLLILTVMALFLSGCTDLNKETFSYFNGNEGEKKKYFDDYATIYENKDYNFTIFAVRSKEILDEQGFQSIHYILKWDLEKTDRFSLSCGNYTIYKRKNRDGVGGNKYNLISGEEISDYCQDSSFFTLTIDDHFIKDNITIYNNTNAGELDWKGVSTLSESNINLYIIQNSSILIVFTVIIAITVIVIVGYRNIYKINKNNFCKLPEPSITIVILIAVSIGALGLLTEIYDKKNNYYDNNFIYYELKEESTNYLPEFVNRGYELVLLESNGKQEVYIDKKNSDELSIIFVLVNGEKKYYVDAVEYSYPNVSDIDGCHIDLMNQEMDDGGLRLGHLVECYKIIESQEISEFSSSLGKTKSVGESGKILEDVYPHTMYYKNRKGYYIIYNHALE